jgi:putative ABC transport system permease protein
MVTVVGVVEDVRQEFIDRTPQPAIYTSAAQFPERSTDFVVRTAHDPMQSAAAVRAAVAAIDPMQPVFQLRTMRKLVNDSITGIRHTAAMMSVLGLVALVLASVGVYSLMAWSVGERTREMGIRIALGALPGQVMWAVLRRTAGLVCLGIAVGMAGSVAMARMLSGLIFGVTPGDPVTFTLVPAVLLTMTLIACVAPAIRALRTDPVKALHYE